MKLFVDDRPPGLGLSPSALPTPWVLPSEFSPSHRERLVRLLAGALRSDLPDLVVMKLAWRDRGLVEQGRLTPTAPFLLWWQIDRRSDADPRDVLKLGASGLNLFDFEAANDLPAQSWLGPLKLELLRSLIDLLSDRAPVRESEAALAVLRGLAEKIISPIDLLDAAEWLIEGLALAMPIDLARARACGRLIVGRILPAPDDGDRIVGALRAMAGGQAVADPESSLLATSGLLESGVPVPLASLLAESEILRWAIQEVAEQRGVSRPLEELAPDLFKSEERSSPSSAMTDFFASPNLVELPEVDLAGLVTDDLELRRAIETLRGGATTRAVDQLDRMEHQRRAWSAEAHTIVARLYTEIARRTQNQAETSVVSQYEKVASFLERAAAHATEAGNDELAADNCLRAARAHLNAFQYEPSNTLFARGALLADHVNNPRLAALCRSGQADVFKAQGKLEEALRIQREETLPVFERLGDISARAITLGKISNLLSDLGRREEALQAASEAVDIHRGLAKARPDAFLPALAGSLHNLGNKLSALGRREEALQVTSEAVDIRRGLAKARPDAFLPALAGSLNNLGGSLSDLDRREEALQVTSEAVDIRRGLAKARPDAFLPDLAGSLNNLGISLSDLGRREEALQAASEAADIFRGLVRARPDAFLPDLAGSLNNLGNRLSALGRREEALQVTSEAADIFRGLAKARPDAFLPDLATSLNNLGIRLSALGRREEALIAASEAADIRRGLAKARPDVFLPDLARSLNNLGIRLSALGRREEALQAKREAEEAQAAFDRRR